MNRLERRTMGRAAVAILAVGTMACARSEAESPEAPVAMAAAERSATDEGPSTEPALAPVAGTDPWEAVVGPLTVYLDSADRQLRRVPGLTAAERTALRRDVNERQLERARQLGTRVESDVEPLVRSGQLVRLAESTRYWVVRELDYSVPYVTPDTEAMLVEIGQRFHQRLDSIGVARYRLDITSVLRTPETQASLRRTNRNASRIESAHEFGTTIDIAYRRYAPPAEHPGAGAAGEGRILADSMAIETARLRGAELQAVLGRVLIEMQAEGKLLVMMERGQTVYHTTVGQRFERSRSTE